MRAGMGRRRQESAPRAFQSALCGNEGEGMEIIKLRDEYIKLGQALKAAGLVESGVDAKYAIEEGFVSVNGQTEFQRGKKLRAGDMVDYDGRKIKIEGSTSSPSAE